MRKILFKILTISLFVIVNALEAYSMSPALYFSDLVSGPQTGLGDGKGSGAIVTIWGTNLGDSQGTSTISIAGQSPAYIYYWGRADGSANAGPAQLYSTGPTQYALKIQTISFSVPAGLSNGATTISVKVGGITSNTLPFTVRAGPIYWVAQTGSNCVINGSSNPVTGCGSFSAPFATMAYAAYGSNASGFLVSGSTVYIKNGYSSGLTIGPGCSTFGGGTNALQQNFFIAYPGAVVNLTSIYNACASYTDPTQENKFWSFSKVRCGANNTDVCMQLFNHGRMIANEVYTASGCAAGQSGNVLGADENMSGVMFFGNYIHDTTCITNNDQGGYHTIYITMDTITGNNATDILDPFEIGWNYLANNHASAGIHLFAEYQPRDFNGPIRVHDNITYNQTNACIDWNMNHNNASYVMTANVYIYNNICINTNLSNGGRITGEAIFLHLGGYSGTVYVWNNTIYGCGDGQSGQNCLTYYLIDLTPAVDLRNNLIVSTDGSTFQVGDGQNPNYHTNNLWYNSSAPSTAPPVWDTAPLNVDPMFNNPGSYNFSLQSSSPAKNTGYNTSSILVTDILGTPRGTTPSIGAFQFGVGPSPPTSLLVK